MSRTGIGDVPFPPTMGVVALGLVLQPTTFMIWMLISPAVEPEVLVGSHFLCVPSSTQIMNACKNPTIVTLVAIAEVLSIIGIVTIELLVETGFPDCGPLPAVIFIGAVGHGVGSRVSMPGTGGGPDVEA